MNGKKRQWTKGIAYEVEFWSNWFHTKGSSWPDDYRSRLDPNRPLREWVHELLVNPSEETKLLDVGAGPMTMLGRTLPGGVKIDLTAVDPLAEMYHKLYRRFGVTPPVPTQPAEVEGLSKVFPENTFDLVHMENALDHSYDPIAGIQEMLKVVKTDHYVALSHASDEAERENYQGFHQWNLCKKENDFVVWNKSGQYNITKMLQGRAEVAIQGDDRWHSVTLRKVA